MANLFKVIESMKHKTIPPTWGYEKSPEQVCIEAVSYTHLQCILYILKLDFYKVWG